MRLNVTSGVALFTDGSCWDQDGLGGWAWIALDAFEGEESDSGSASETTNNRMEMQAWIEGLNHIYIEHGPCIILVYCDSQLVGRGFTGQYRRKANTDLWEELQIAADQHEHVEWIWVKGHSDSKYNNEADKLAGEARRKIIEEENESPRSL